MNAAGRKPTTRPNVLLIVADQLRADHLGCYGNRHVHTPNLDALARRGQLYRRFYVTNPICMPNRAAMLTGRMPSANGVRHNGVPLPLESVTLADRLRASGYRTALIGKAHLQTQSRREVPDPHLFPWAPKGDVPSVEQAQASVARRTGPHYELEREERWSQDPQFELPLPYYGFEHAELAIGHGDQVHGHYRRWARSRDPGIDQLIGPQNALPTAGLSVPHAWRTRVPEELHSTRFVADRGIAAIEACASDGQPFFVMCSFPDPHHPFTPPGRFWNLHDPASVELPSSFGQIDPGQPALLARLRSLSMRAEFKPGTFCTQVVNERAAREALALTFGMISNIDDAVGRLLRRLDELGLAGNTIVCFTSDHGDLMGDHSLIYKQGLHYEGVIRVPFLWADPEAPAASVDSLGSTLDVTPTILARAGLAPSSGVQGRDLATAPAAEGLLVEEDELPIHMGEIGATRVTSYVTGRWRLTLWSGDQRGELFDRDADPHELRNRWDDAALAAVKAQLMEAMLRERIRLIDTLPLAERSA